MAREKDSLRIISGGQTGADRGGLDAAIALDVPHGGWCPKGRLAEDGAIPDKYELRESASDRYPMRTRLNVRESDATVIWTRGPLTGGSALTEREARMARKPVLHIDLSAVDHGKAEEQVLAWMIRHNVSILNVAGQRESNAPGIQKEVTEICMRAMARYVAEVGP